MDSLEADLRAFVAEKKADYFLEHWAPMLSGEQPIPKPMLGPGLFHFWWLCYRGLLLHAALVALTIGILAGTVANTIGIAPESFWEEALSRFLTVILPGAAVSILGGRWYLHRALREIQSVRAILHDDFAVREELGRRGGPRWGAFIVGVVACSLLAGGALWLTVSVFSGEPFGLG